MKFQALEGFGQPGSVTHAQRRPGPKCKLAHFLPGDCPKLNENPKKMKDLSGFCFNKFGMEVSVKILSCSRHRTTKFPNSESPIFTTKFCLSYFLLDQKQDQQSAAPSITLSKRASKNVFHKKINNKVNKQNIRNSENWLFDDVSEI